MKEDRRAHAGIASETDTAIQKENAHAKGIPRGSSVNFLKKHEFLRIFWKKKLRKFKKKTKKTRKMQKLKKTRKMRKLRKFAEKTAQIMGNAIF